MDSKKIEPIDNDGTSAVKFGILSWTLFLAFVVGMQNKFSESQFQEIVSICVSGLILGILGFRYTTNRVKRLKKATEPNQSDLIHDFE